MSFSTVTRYLSIKYGFCIETTFEFNIILNFKNLKQIFIDKLVGNVYKIEPSSLKSTIFDFQQLHSSKMLEV